MTMVKLIIMDVDGVIVGHKKGVNFPYPSPKVLSALKKVRQIGIPVVLCSGKYHPVIEPIILQANLDNPHITDAGSLIINPIAKEVYSFNIETVLVSSIINVCLQNYIHTEMYSIDDYFTQKNIGGEILPQRIAILQRNPIVVESLAKEAEKHNVIKLIIVSRNEEERRKTEKILEKFQGQITSTWTMHPSTKEWEYCVITSTEASKAHAARTVAEELGISFEETLGVGDTLGDWEFMKLCGYAATMEDASPELKRLVESKGEGKYFVGPSVNDDGILKILDYFLMLK